VAVSVLRYLTLSTGRAGTPGGDGRFLKQKKRARHSFKEQVMRSLQLILTASGFLSIFTGMFFMSAFATSVVHSAVSPRPVPIAIVFPQ